MNNAIPNLVGDIILGHETDADRLKAATDLVAYSLAAIAAMSGQQTAAEIAYRCADTVAGAR